MYVSDRLHFGNYEEVWLLFFVLRKYMEIACAFELKPGICNSHINVMCVCAVKRNISIHKAVNEKTVALCFCATAIH